MKKNWSIIFLCLFLPWMWISSCKEKDSKIQADVEQTLKENADMTGLSATVKDGVVTLTGECKNDASKSSIESAIGKIKGVKQVVNNCTVAPTPTVAAPVVITEDDALVKAVNDATKDYPGVKATVNGGVITLTGDIKKTDLQKLMMTLNGLKPKKIENKLTIK